MHDRDWTAATNLLRLASQLIDDVQAGLAARDFVDVRPAHGFAFVRIAAGDATTADVAAHLGVTKQAAAELVQQLVERGYVERRAHPSDRRARLLALTERGRACTGAAEDAAAESVRRWGEQLGPTELATLRVALARLVRPGPLRPGW